MREKNICSRSFLSELLMIGRTICVLRYSSKSFDFTRVFFKLKCAGLIRSEKPRQLRVLLSDGGINNVSEAFLNPVSEKTLKWKQQKYYVCSWYASGSMKLWSADKSTNQQCVDTSFSDADTTTCFLIQVLVIPARTTGHEGSINDIILSSVHTGWVQQRRRDLRNYPQCLHTIQEVCIFTCI